LILTTLRRVALAAVILVVPSVMVGVAVVHRSKSISTTPPASVPTATDAVAVTARLEPYHSVVFTKRLDPSAAPPAKTCQSAMSAMQALGGSPAFVGRLKITFQATRTVQLRIDKITVLTVRRENVKVTAVATCAESETPSPFPGEPTFNESFPFGSGGSSYTTPVVILADQFATTAPPMVIPFFDPTPINETTFDLRSGTTNTVPIYLLASGGPTFRTGLQIAVDLTINDLPHHQTLTNAGTLFWLYESGFRQGDGPIRQWTPTTKTWQTL
jgi:hypothetical protein